MFRSPDTVDENPIASACSGTMTINGVVLGRRSYPPVSGDRSSSSYYAQATSAWAEAAILKGYLDVCQKRVGH